MPNSTYREVTLRDGRTLTFNEYGSPSGRPIIHCHGAPSSRIEGDLILNRGTASALDLHMGALPNCRATFYAEDAHLSVPFNHQEEILGTLSAALDQAATSGTA